MIGSAWPDTIAALTCGLRPDERSRKPFLLLVAHFDDSGSEGKGHAFVVSGYVATTEQWSAFSAEWHACLQREPKLEYFKMKEAHRRQDQFRGWSVADRDAKVSEFASIINRHVAFGVTTIVWWDDFREFEKWIAPNPTKAYTLLFVGSIVRALDKLIEDGINDKLEIIFDNQDALGSRAGSIFSKIYLSMSQKYRDKLAGQPVHRDERYMLPLQAADMIAWNTRRCITKDGIQPSGIALELADIVTATQVYTPLKLARIAQAGRDLWAQFPDINQRFTEDEMQAVRKVFLGDDKP